MRILVVDDHEMVRRGVRSFLRLRPEFEVCGEAVNGEDAVAKATELRPDVILMDVNMPKMNGLSATREIRKLLPETKVVMLSQHGSTELKREALSAGAKGYVDKAAISTELPAALENIGHSNGAKNERMQDIETYARQMIDSLPLAIYTTDAEGRLTHFNPAAVEFSGRVPELGTDQWCVSWKLYEADGSPLPHERCPMAILLKGGTVSDGIECIAERPDGTRRWFTPYPRALRDASGRLVGGMNMLLDITERKQAQAATNLLAAIVNSTDDAIISKSLDGIITTWNKSAEKLLGYTAEEAIGKNITLIIPPERRKEEDYILGRMRHGEAIEHFETVRRKKDGSYVDLSLTITPVINAQGKVIGASKVARDITERKRADRASGLLAAIVDSSEDAIVSKNLDGIITSWNKSAERMLGYKAEEAVGKHITLIIPPERRAEENDIISRIRRGERVDHFETVRMRKDGTLIDLSLTISPVKDGKGRIIGASKVARDVTDRKRAEITLRESEQRYRSLAQKLDLEVQARTRELEKRNVDAVRQSEQVRELSWRLLRTQDEERRRIARELHDSTGQLLAALQLNLSLLAQTEPNLAPEATKHLEGAIQITDQATKEIRTMSYLLHPPLLDEMGLSGALQWYVHGLMERSGLDVRLDVPDSFGRLSPEIELVIFRIVQESLTNVHRHSGSKRANIRLSRIDQNVIVEVEDSGCGIPPDKLLDIQTRGVGLGIRGMYERVRQLQGEMDMKSDENGTRVRVRIPVSASRGATHANVTGTDLKSA